MDLENMTREELLQRKRELLLEKKRQIEAKQFNRGDILPSIGRGITATIGLIGDVQQGILSGIGVPENIRRMIAPPNTEMIRGTIDKGVDALGGDPDESVFTGGEETLRGRALEFGGSTVAFGAPGIIRKATLEGSKLLSREVAKQAGKQFAGGAAAGAGSHMGEEAYGVPGAIAGSFAPAALKGAVAGSVRSLLRGAGWKKLREYRHNLVAARRQGASPTAGSVSPVPRAATIERAFESLPGAHGPFLRNADKNAEGLQAKLSSFMRNRGYTEDVAGGFLASGVKQKLDTFRTESKRLYSEAEALITNPNVLIDVKPFVQTIKKLASQENQSIKHLADAIKTQDDVAGRLLTQMVSPNAQVSKFRWKDMNDLRQVIGQQISLFKSIGDPNQGALKALYSSLTKQVQLGAEAAGGVSARKAFNHANAYYRRNRKIVDRLIDPMMKQGMEPEVLFRNVVGTALNKPTKLRLVMDGLNPVQQDYVARTFVSRLAHIDDQTGVVIEGLWSPGNLIRNWSKIPPTRKDELFSTDRLRSFRWSLDRYMKVLEGQKRAAGILANPSGTAGTGLAAATLQSALANTGKIATLGLAGTATIGGAFGALATIGLAAAGANAGARLMNSPQFINWLARSSTATPKQLPAMIGRLGNLAQNSSDPEFIEALAIFNEALRLEFEPEESE